MYLSRKDLEGIGKKAYEAYLNLPKIRLQEDVKRVDPIVVAENMLGLSIDYQHLSLNKLTFGLTSYDPTPAIIFDDEDNKGFYPLDGRTVLIETDIAKDKDMPGKFHFTLMHECCHHILRRLYPNSYGAQLAKTQGLRYYRAQNDYPKPITDWEEWQASALASVILIPEELLRQNMKEVGIGDELEILNSRYRTEYYNMFFRLAILMGVSLQALHIRMSQLGLIRRDYYHHPNGIFDIEKD